MSDNLDTLGITALKAIARAEGIAGYSQFRSATKGDLAALIRAQRGVLVPVEPTSTQAKEFIIPEQELSDIFRRLTGKKYKPGNYEELDEVFLEVANEWLKAQKLPIQRGDTVAAEKYGKRYRNDTTVIFDGQKLISLNYDLYDYGSTPAEFLVGTEFPISYWDNVLYSAPQFLPIDLNRLNLQKTTIVGDVQRWDFKTAFGPLVVLVDPKSKMKEFEGTTFFLRYDPEDMEISGYDPNTTVVDPSLAE